MASLDDKKNV